MVWQFLIQCDGLGFTVWSLGLIVNVFMRIDFGLVVTGSIRPVQCVRFSD